MDQATQLRQAFVTAVWQRTPDAINRVRRAAQKLHDRGADARSAFRLPGGWLVRYHVTAVAVTFEIPTVCIAGTDVATAVHRMATAAIACAFAEELVTPKLRSTFRKRRGEPAEGWELAEIAEQAVLAVMPHSVPALRRAIARALIEETSCSHY